MKDLLEAGIKVIASINIQYIAELREQVEAITGKHVTQTVPISFIQERRRNRDRRRAARRTDGTLPGRTGVTRKREERLSKLRELALVLAADVVDHQLSDYLERHGIRQQFRRARADSRMHNAACQCARDDRRSLEPLLERFHGELIVAYVNQPQISPEDQATLDEKLAIAQARWRPHRDSGRR